MHKLFPECERLRVKERLTLKEIHQRTGVAPSTLSKWNRKFNWDARMNDWLNSSMHIAERLQFLLNQELQDVEQLDNKAVDKVIKAVKSIRYLNQDADILGNTIMVMEQYGTFLQLKSAKMFSEFQNILPDFLVHMREKFKKQ